MGLFLAIFCYLLTDFLFGTFSTSQSAFAQADTVSIHEQAIRERRVSGREAHYSYFEAQLVQSTTTDSQSFDLAEDAKVKSSLPENLHAVYVNIDQLYAPIAIHVEDNQQLITEPGYYRFEVAKRKSDQYRVELIDPYSIQRCAMPSKSKGANSVHQSALQIRCIKNDNALAYYDW